MTWSNVIPLLLFTAILILVLFVVRPMAKRKRHEAWERAGLLPHQVDPHTAHEDPATERLDSDAPDTGDPDTGDLDADGPDTGERRPDEGHRPHG